MRMKVVDGSPAHQPAARDASIGAELQPNNGEMDISLAYASLLTLHFVTHVYQENSCVCLLRLYVNFCTYISSSVGMLVGQS